MTPFPPERVASGATNTPNPTPGTPEAFQAVSDDLRARLAGLVRQPFDGWACSPTEAYALRVAEAVLADGFRRVVEDDDTIERLARAIHDAECGTDDLCKGYDAHGEWDRKWRDDAYESVARAVVRALREDT